jgi:hypothetical protein
MVLFSFFKKIEAKYQSGCETLFYTPVVYRRVNNLAAGRSGFIIPGIISKTDLFISCELKTPIIGKKCFTYTNIPSNLSFANFLRNLIFILSRLAF